VVDKLDVQRGGWSPAGRVPEDETCIQLTGLNNGHDYNFRVYAENKIGVGEPLEMKASVKCKSKYDLPSHPRDFKAVEVGEDSVKLSWMKPEYSGGAGAEIFGYLVEKKEMGRSHWAQVSYTEPGTLCVPATGLLEGRPYNFRVMAENQEGLSKPTELKEPVTPLRQIDPPSAPQDVDCVKVREGPA